MANNTTWYIDYIHMGAFNIDQFGTGAFLGASLSGAAFILLLIWAIAIKGYALWHASRRGEQWWFIALLVINTFGILEILYLIFVAKVLFQKKPIQSEPSNDK